MGAVNFYLKKAEKVSGKSLIYLQFKFNGKKLVFSFGQNIRPMLWNPKKQRVKSNTQTTEDGKHSLNDLLDNLKVVCEKTYNTELKSGIPGPDTIKKSLINFLYQNEAQDEKNELFGLIERFINNEIKHKGQDKSKNTLKTYKTLYGHLRDFFQKERIKVCFDSITLDFYYKYVSYLKARRLSQNAIAKDIQILKVIMGEAYDLRLTDNLQFKIKKFAVTREETDAVYLTKQELINLYRYEFSQNKRLEQVRDLFVFGSFVGLRFSDFSDVKPENIVEIDGDLFIKLTTKKTKEQVIIPCNPIVKEIFKKYSLNANRLPKSLSNQKFNDYIKEACKEAGLVDKGRLGTDLNRELWECISSHTARRSFATNYYLEAFPTLDLMKITGHRTEKAFMRYIKTTKLDSAKRLNIHNKKQWSELLLRVAS